MQRRAAAIYVAFFLVVGAASFSLIATASAPQLSFENPDHRLNQGDTFTVGDQEYAVSGISAEVESGGGGGHGGGGGGAELVRSGTLEFTNESALYTVEWANGSSVTYENQSWTVATDNGSETVTLVENVNRTAILQNDDDVENETTTVDGQEYVVERAGDNRTLIPAAEYFPAPETREFDVGDEVDNVEDNTATIASVTSEAATLEYVAPRTNEISVAHHANVTVGGTTYFAHFPDNSTMVLTQEFDTYHAYEEETATQTRLTNGLWGVTILSGVSAFFLLGLAYMPSRY
ncbi:hypothetical protein [Halobaculum marinum]|uniref:Uncharacterized protein n=1 Tax=Halobaculum marinum TaxID=3031996 RepID=A0ABD5WUI8_9EURY|nr:hypothetical protein [Halobaculum sp. DT55]